MDVINIQRKYKEKIYTDIDENETESEFWQRKYVNCVLIQAHLQAQKEED